MRVKVAVSILLLVLMGPRDTLGFHIHSESSVAVASSSDDDLPANPVPLSWSKLNSQARMIEGNTKSSWGERWASNFAAGAKDSLKHFVKRNFVRIGFMCVLSGAMAPLFLDNAMSTNIRLSVLKFLEIISKLGFGMFNLMLLFQWSGDGSPSQFASSADNSDVMSIGRTKTALLLLVVSFITSIDEEIIFRWLLNWPLWVYEKVVLSFSPKCSTEETIDYQVQQKKYKRLEKARRNWVVLKGVCFGALHVSNWIPRDGSMKQSGGEPLLQMVQIIGAVTQAVFAGWLSIRVFDPIAETHGLAGSIGAHVMHNILILFVMLLLPDVEWSSSIIQSYDVILP